MSTALYTNLLNSAQQLRVARAGTVGDVRVIDDAVTAQFPIAPRKPLIVLLSGVLGGLASLGLVWAIRALRVVVEDPDAIERELALPVYATVPESTAEEELDRRVKRGKGLGELLAVTHPDDSAVESLRSLRRCDGPCQRRQRCHGQGRCGEGVAQESGVGHPWQHQTF